MIIYCTLNKVNGKLYVGKNNSNNKYYYGSGWKHSEETKKHLSAVHTGQKRN